MTTKHHLSDLSNNFCRHFHWGNEIKLLWVSELPIYRSEGIYIGSLIKQIKYYTEGVTRKKYTKEREITKRKGIIKRTNQARINVTKINL